MPQAIDLLCAFNSFLDNLRLASKQELEQFADLVLSEVPSITNDLTVRKIGFIQIQVAAQIKDLLKQGEMHGVPSQGMGRSNPRQVQKCTVFQ